MTQEGGGLLGDMARMFSNTPQEARALRTALEARVRARSHDLDGPHGADFKRLGADTAASRALIVEHYEGSPPHSDVTERVRGDGVIVTSIVPTNPVAGCLACARDLRDDGYEVEIGAIEEPPPPTPR